MKTQERQERKEFLQNLKDCEQDKIHEIQWRRQNKLDRRGYELMKVEENLERRDSEQGERDEQQERKKGEQRIIDKIQNERGRDRERKDAKQETKCWC